MKKNSQINKDEIDLIELMYIVWKGKWKIGAAVAISLIAMISYQSTQTHNFTAITKIRPMSYVEINKYQSLNNSIANINNRFISSSSIYDEPDFIMEGKLPQITSSELLNLYLKIIDDKSLLEDGIRKFNLLDTSQYNDDQEYNEEIIRLASSIKIFSAPVNGKAKKGNLETSYSTINFIYHDVEKWKSVLIYVDEFANKLVKKLLIEKYSNTLSLLEIKRKYQLEDISVKINNILIDYEREISDRMAYLEEQSAIAKKLGIAKNTIEVQTFGNQNALLSNVQTDSPFYLRGYEAIDKEIELIELRKDKNAFIAGLFELEKKKRAIEQDKTIERVKLALQSNLLADNKIFSAALINPSKTKFEYIDYKKIYVLAIVIGLIAGIFYVLISNAFQSFRVSKKN